MNSVRTVKDLVDELLNLKSCQIDMVKISIGLFTFVTSVVAAIIGFAIKIEFLNETSCADQGIVYIFYLTILTLLIIVPVSLPIFMRIIIHKCRSIFRLLGYIRLTEEIKYSQSKNTDLIPFEYGYSRLRFHPLLLDRISTFEHEKALTKFRKLFAMIWNEIRGKNWKNIEGVCLRELKVYIGRYYTNIWFFLKLLATIHLIISIILVAFINLKYGGLNLFCISFNFISVSLLIWCIYNTFLIKRYFKEIHYYPFSICSWYCLFKILNENVKGDRYDKLSEKDKKELIIKFKDCLTMACT